MYEVYKITNKLNGKIYIGITKRGFEKRIKEHIQEATQKLSNYTIHKAIRKYGKEGFTYEVIEQVDTEESAKEREIFWIQHYNSWREGYNDTPGGDLNTQLKGENSSRHKITMEQLYQIYDLLKNTTLSFVEIIEKLQLPIKERQISAINKGEQWFQLEIDYPVRKNPRSISKNGAKNPQSSLTEEQVLDIIDKLENTTISQTALAKEYGVHFNTINYINNCKTWTYLHNYQKNIRKHI